MRVKGGADLFDVGSMAAYGFVELAAGDAKLFRPVGDIGGHFGVDLFGIVRTFGVLFVEGVRFVSFRASWCSDIGCFLVSVLLGG